MDSAAAAVSLYAAKGAQTPNILAPSGSLLIRAPLSSEDNDSPFASDAGSEEEEEEEEEEFATASDPEEESVESALAVAASAAFKGDALPRSSSMPKAKLTRDDDFEVEVFEEGLDDEEADMDGFSGVARVPLFDQNPSLVDKGVDLREEGDVPSPETEFLVATDGKFQLENLEGFSDENLKLQESFKHGKYEILVGELEGSMNSNEMEDDKPNGAEVENSGAKDSLSSKNQGMELEEANSNAVVNLKASGARSADSKQQLEGAKPPAALANGNESSERSYSAIDSDNFEASSEKDEEMEVSESIPYVGSVMKGEPSTGSTGLSESKRAEDFSDRLVAADEAKSLLENASPIQGTRDEKSLPPLDQAAKVSSASDEDSLPDLTPILGAENESRGKEVTSLVSSQVAVDSNAQSTSYVVEPDMKQGDDVSTGVDNESYLISNEAMEEQESSSATAILLGSSKTGKRLTEEPEDGSSYTSHPSRLDGSKDEDGKIVPDSDEEAEGYEEEDAKGMLDYNALLAMLQAASSSVRDGSSTATSEDGNSISLVEHPASLGSYIPSLERSSSRKALPNHSTHPELGVVAEPEDNMTEEEKILHDKLEQTKVKFLRLVHRLGHSPDDTVAAQVLFRLSLAEGIRHGRQTNRAMSLDNVRKVAMQLEADGREGLDFSCNILVLGKSGVGKSATINSIFGEEKSHTSAFQPATDSIKEILGTINGVKIRVIDTPGLRPSVMDQASNRRILLSAFKYTKRCPPDIVLYVDRMDTQTRDLNDLPLLRSITSTLGTSIWFKAVVVLTHAASAPPDGPSGSPLSYDMLVAQRSHVIQHSIRQVAGDMRLVSPVALAENHPSCRRNSEGQRVLPNGLNWRSRLLLLCYSSKILSEANSLLKLQDLSPGKLFGFSLRSPPLPFLLSSLLQSRPHPKLPAGQSGETGDSDVDLDDLLATDQQQEDEYDQLPPFKPLKQSQIAKLTKEQRRAYFDEYDYRVKLLQKKQLKEELNQLKEAKKKGKDFENYFGYANMAEDVDQDTAPAAVPVPLPDMVLPPSFDCDTPTYRYRFLEPMSQFLARPILDTRGWDHDCGYDGVNLEQSLSIAGRFPALLSAQVTKDKKEFSLHLESSILAKHGENGSTLLGFDMQTIGKQLGYILQGETKFRNLKKNKTGGRISITFLGESVVTGVKFEDQLSVGKRVSLGASTGAVRAQDDVAYGANLEAHLRDKFYPIGRSLSTLGLSLMKWRGDLALGANLESQFTVGRNSNMTVRVGLNNKLTGKITVRTSTSEQLQIALIGILPIAISIFQSLRPGESFVC